MWKWNRHSVWIETWKLNKIEHLIESSWIEYFIYVVVFLLPTLHSAILQYPSYIYQLSLVWRNSMYSPVNGLVEQSELSDQWKHEFFKKFTVSRRIALVSSPKGFVSENTRQGETNFLTKILPESSLSSDGTSVNIPHNGNKCGVSTNYQPTAQMRMRSCFDASVSPWQLLYRGILCGTEARKLAERGVCAYWCLKQLQDAF